MAKYLFITRSLKLLISHNPGRLLLIFAVTLLQGISMGFSIVLLIPMLQLLNAGESGSANSIVRFFQNVAEKSGIDLNLSAILLTYIILLVFSAFLQYWKSFLDTDYQKTFIYNLRRNLFRKVILADWRLLRLKGKSDHIQILTKEIPNLGVYYIYYLRLLTALVITASYIVYALVVSPVYTLAIMVTCIVLFIFLFTWMFKTFGLGKTYVESYGRLYKYIDDFWLTIKIAKVHSSEKFHYDKFDEAGSSLLRMEYLMERNWALPQLIYRIAGILVLATVVFIGMSSANPELTSIFILILLFSRIFPQFVSITGDVNMLVSNAASAEKVLRLNEEYSDNQFEKATTGRHTSPENEIRFENLHFSWPDGEVLFNDFSEVIKAGSITGIIGESGRGKTTLLDLIVGLQKPDSGRIIVDGKPLDDISLATWKSGLGYLPQDPFFIDGTLRENLIWDSMESIDDMDILRVLKQVKADHLVSRFENRLDTSILNYQTTFSGGECQKLALARVLLRKPRLLLLDEATSSLDAENEELIMEVIKQLKDNVTIIFVTHRISLLPWFDKVIKL